MLLSQGQDLHSRLRVEVSSAWSPSEFQQLLQGLSSATWVSEL